MRTYSVKQQQGSALVWLVSLTMIVGMLALVVESSFAYMQKRELQSAANFLATVAVNDVQTCSFQNPSESFDFAEARAAFTSKYGSKGFEITDIKWAEASVSEPSSGEVRHHIVAGAESAAHANAVAVKVKKEWKGLLSVFNSEFTLIASAVAKKEAYSTFYTESGLLSLNTGNSPLLGLVLGGILGQNLSLSGINFSEINNLVVDVGDLLTNIGGSSVKTLGIGALLEQEFTAKAIGEALSAVSTITAPIGDGLDALVGEIIAAPNMKHKVKLGEVLRVVGSDEVPTGVKVPLFSLLGSTVMSVGKQLQVIELCIDPDSQALCGSDTQGPVKVRLKVSIDESPTVLISSAKKDEFGDWPKAESADISVEALIDLDIPFLAKVSIPLSIEGGQADAELRRAECARGSNNSVRFGYEVTKTTAKIATKYENYDEIMVRILGTSNDKFCERMDRNSCEAIGSDAEFRSRSVQWIDCCMPKLFGNGENCWPEIDTALACPLGNKRYRNTVGECCLPNVRPNSCEGSSSVLCLGIKLGDTNIYDNISTESVNTDLIQLLTSQQESHISEVDIGNAQALRNSLLPLIDSLKVSVDVLGLPLGKLLDIIIWPIKEAIKGLLDVVITGVLSPLLSFLGISLGEATVNTYAANQAPIVLIENCFVGDNQCNY